MSKHYQLVRFAPYALAWVVVCEGSITECMNEYKPGDLLRQGEKGKMRPPTKEELRWKN